VTVEEADHFAKWLNGHLPTTEQWDKAAGRYEASRGEGPYQGSWRDNPKPSIAVQRRGPVAVGSSESDVSPFDCRDMAGNGYEWTCTLRFGKGLVPILKPRVDDLVCLRGRSFEEPEPLRYDDLDDKNNILPCLPYQETQHDLGFRVVIKP